MNETDTGEIARAARALEAQKPLMRTYNSDTFSGNLLTGEVWMTRSYSGQVAQGINDNPNVGYATPNRLAVETLAPEWRDNRAVFPPRTCSTAAS